MLEHPDSFVSNILAKECVGQLKLVASTNSIPWDDVTLVHDLINGSLPEQSKETIGVVFFSVLEYKRIEEELKKKGVKKVLAVFFSDKLDGKTELELVDWAGLE